jgi:tetratricopeptide (TPR) repeat protein
MHAVNARLDQAELDLQQAFDIGRTVGDSNLQALILHMLALRRSWQGQYAESLSICGEGVRLAREHRLVIPLLRCLWNQRLVWHELGDHDAAVAVLNEGLALAEKIGDTAYIAR